MKEKNNSLFLHFLNILLKPNGLEETNHRMMHAIQLHQKTIEWSVKLEKNKIKLVFKCTSCNQNLMNMNIFLLLNLYFLNQWPRKYKNDRFQEEYGEKKTKTKISDHPSERQLGIASLSDMLISDVALLKNKILDCSK